MEYDELAQEFIKLIEIMKTLRSPKGCPWDREQDYYSLKPYILEEAYEVRECLENEDIISLKEELGDLLLQVIFQSQIGKEKGDFDIFQVLTLLNEKLIRRHPHVFAEKEVENVSDVLDTWNSIKDKEKSESNKTASGKKTNDNIKSESIVDDISNSQPALNQAYEIQAKASEVGFDWNKPDEVFDKINEELNELGQALDEGSQDDIKEEIGDLFFSLVNLTRFYKMDPEVVLFSSVLKFKNRFKYIEKMVNDSDRDFAKYSLEELEKLWVKSKKIDKKVEE